MIFNITNSILQSQLNQITMIKSFMKIGRSWFLTNNKGPKDKLGKPQNFMKKNSPSTKRQKGSYYQTIKQKEVVEPVVSWLQKKPVDMIQVNHILTEIKNLIIQAKYQQITKTLSTTNKQQIKKALEEIGQLCEIILGQQLTGKFSKKTPLKLQAIINIINSLQKDDVIEKHHYWISELLNSYIDHHKQLRKKLQQDIQKQIHDILCLASKHFSEHFKTNKTYFKYVAHIYFQKDEKLGEFLQLVSVAHTDHFHDYISLLEQQFMMHRITHNKSAFTITEQLVQHYKKSYETQDYHVAVGCILIAMDADFAQIPNHFKQYMTLGFSKMPLDIGRKVIEKVFLKLSQNNEQTLNGLMKTSKNIITNILAAIKLGNHQQAFTTFEEKVLKPKAIQRMRLNLLFILKKYNLEFINLSQKQYGIPYPEQVVQRLSPQYLWDLYKKKNQFLIEFKDKLGDDIHSYWKSTFQKLKTKEIYAWQALGLLDEVSQTYVEQNEFNLQKYLDEQYPQKKTEYELEYEKEKEFIKFCLKMQYAIEQYITQSDESVQKTLSDAQQALNFEENKKIFQDAGLLNYKIDKSGWKPFFQRYRHFHRNNFVVKDQSVYQYFQQGKSKLKNLSAKRVQDVTKDVVDEIALKYREFWDEAQNVVKLNQLDSSVIEFIRWGLYMKQPIAIYMGEKLAITSSRYIPHEIAQQVSNMLSYRREIDQAFLNKCRQALRIVGKISRVHIYDPNKDYHHILRRNQLSEISEKWAKYEQLNQPRFEDFQLWTSNWTQRQQQLAYYLKSAKKGPL